MQKRIRDHIRANVVGYVAVFLALTGSAYAIDGPLPGQNQVGSEDIINLEVKAADLGADSVGSGKIVDRSVKNADLSIGASSSNTIADGGVASVDVKNDDLTGADINESTLGKVQDADTLDGVDSTGFASGPGRIQKLDFRANNGTGLTQVLDLGGLELFATCDSSFGQGPKDLRIFWSSAVDNASLGVSYSQFLDPTAHTDYTSDLPTGGTISEGDLSSVDDDRTAGTMVYTRPDGGNVSVAFQAEDSNGSPGSDALGGTRDCIFTGTATYTP